MPSHTLTPATATTTPSPPPQAAYCINLLTRLATLPLRRRLPDFYILGFPVCGGLLCMGLLT